MRVLVVGATGAVGRQVVPQLRADGHDVVATYCSHPPPDPPEGVSYRRLDLLEGDAAAGLIAEYRPDAIIHQATALSGLGNNLRRFDHMFAATNRLRTVGTAALVSAARANGTPRLIVQSFCGWPWQPTGGPVKTEADQLDPDPPRAFRLTFAALVELERLVAGYPNGVVLRYGGLYGPGTSLGDGGAQIEAIRKGWLPLVGDAGGVWSFLHTRDAASAAVAALHRGHGVYNVVDDHPAPVVDWLPELARLTGGPAPRRIPVWLGRLVGGDGLVRLMTTVRGSSNAKVRAELGWSPRWPSWRDGFAAEMGATSAARPAGSR